MTNDLNTIVQRINAGDIDEARRALVSLLRNDPQNTDAWTLLATLFDDPANQADCYRRILRIGPNNRRAAARLQAITSRLLEPSYQEKPSSEEEQSMCCPQCGGAMKVHFVGEMRDKRAICQYCQTEVDLPDTYRRVKKKRTHEQRIGGSRTVEETIIETRGDGQIPSDAPESLPPEIQEVMKILKEKGPAAIDDESLQKLQARGINISFAPESFDPETFRSLRERGLDISDELPLEHSSKTVINRTEDRDDSFLGRLFSRTGRTRQEPGLISPEEIIRLAGGPLPPEKRRKCPNPKCGATISKDAKKCSWCGRSL